MSFDPYHQWLGIPAKEQPPHHYRLLGIELFEGNPAVIENAADQRMVHLRNFQGGEHSAVSQRLLNEVAAARVCLLNPKKKAAYDRALRERLEAAQEARPKEQPKPLDPGLARLFDKTAHVPTHVPSAAPQAARRARQTQFWAGAGIVAVGLLVIVVILIRAGGSTNHTDVSDDKTATVQPEEQKPPKTPPLLKVQPKKPKLPDTPPQPKPPEVSNLQLVESPPAGTGETPVPSQPPVAEKPRRWPVPSQADQEKLLAQLSEVYELSKERTPSDRRKLAADLLDVAEKARERLAERYVLLDAAMRLACEGGDAARMLELAEQIGGEFEIDLLRVKAKMLEAFAEQAKDGVRIRSLLDASDKLIADALRQDEYDLAQGLADRAYAACQQTAGREHRKRAFDRRKEIQALAAGWTEVQGAIDKLKTAPNDPEANLTVGRYFCFVKGDWDKGLPHLALGSDSDLKDAAVNDLKGAATAAEQAALGDAWWALAEKQKGRAKESIMLRAGSWYQQAEPNLAGGLARATVEKRLAEIAKLGQENPESTDGPPRAVAPFDEKKAKEFQARWAKHLKVPVVQTNSVGMKLVLLPPGDFEMGSPKELIEEELTTADGWYKDRLPGEGPRHRVRITKPFYLGMYEVTQEEYQRVMGANPSWCSASGQGKDQVAGEDTRRFPVEMISWDDATEFCRRLSDLPEEKTAGRRYRLPSEAQWEYACRAGSMGRFGFSSGNGGITKESEEHALSDYGWFGGNAGGRTHAVGGKRVSAWGLYDMHGNVWEWCQDWYDKDYYAKLVTDDSEGPPGGSDRVSRGGGWINPAGRCRSAIRSNLAPGLRNPHLGFRVSLVLADK